MKHYKPIHPNHFKSLSLRETQTSPRHRYQIARAQEIQSPMMNENTIYETIEIQMIVVEWSKGPRHKSRWLCRGNTIFASEEIERRRHIEILDQVLHREILTFIGISRTEDGNVNWNGQIWSGEIHPIETEEIYGFGFPMIQVWWFEVGTLAGGSRGLVWSGAT